MLRPVWGARASFQEAGNGGRPSSLRLGLGGSEAQESRLRVHRRRYSFWGRRQPGPGDPHGGYSPRLTHRAHPGAWGGGTLALLPGPSLPLWPHTLLWVFQPLGSARAWDAGSGRESPCAPTASRRPLGWGSRVGARGEPASLLRGPQGCEAPGGEGPGAHEQERRGQGTRVARAPGKNTEGELLPALVPPAECAAHVLGEGTVHPRLEETGRCSGRNPPSDSALTQARCSPPPSTPQGRGLLRPQFHAS